MRKGSLEMSMSRARRKKRSFSQKPKTAERPEGGRKSRQRNVALKKPRSIKQGPAGVRCRKDLERKSANHLSGEDVNTLHEDTMSLSLQGA